MKEEGRHSHRELGTAAGEGFGGDRKGCRRGTGALVYYTSARVYYVDRYC